MELKLCGARESITSRAGYLFLRVRDVAKREKEH